MYTSGYVDIMSVHYSGYVVYTSVAIWVYTYVAIWVYTYVDISGWYTLVSMGVNQWVCAYTMRCGWGGASPLPQ